VKFLVDNQLPAALAEHLRTRGVDCQHVLHIGLAEATDVQICRYAMEQERVIISKDEDFLHCQSAGSEDQSALGPPGQLQNFGFDRGF
jgi:predicted nuclease of predicted toxin-antitoxin system